MLEIGAFHPAWGDIHPGPENALKALSLLGGGSGARLLMPRLGEAIEREHAGRIEPWWRMVDGQRGSAAARPTTLPEGMSWPID